MTTYSRNPRILKAYKETYHPYTGFGPVDIESTRILIRGKIISRTLYVNENGRIRKRKNTSANQLFFFLYAVEGYLRKHNSKTGVMLGKKMLSYVKWSPPKRKCGYLV